MTEKFRDVEPLNYEGAVIAHISAYPTNHPNAYLRGMQFDIGEARALRDWLDKALGDRPSSPPEILKEPT